MHSGVIVLRVSTTTFSSKPTKQGYLKLAYSAGTLADNEHSSSVADASIRRRAATHKHPHIAITVITPICRRYVLFPDILRKRQPFM